jgi:hypothetical protein
MRKGAKFTLEFALIADGVKPDDVYKVLGTKAGAERAFKKLDQIKSSIQWWEAGAQPPQLLAAGDVVMHVRSRKVLHDVLTAVKLGTPVAQCGFGLQPNAEAHLRPRLRLAAIYPSALLAHTAEVAARCTFSLDELRYQYPMETVLPGTTPAETLRRHTEAGARVRYPQGVPPTVLKEAGPFGILLGATPKVAQPAPVVPPPPPPTQAPAAPGSAAPAAAPTPAAPAKPAAGASPFSIGGGK